MMVSGVGRTRRELFGWVVEQLSQAGIEDPAREAWRLLTPSRGGVPPFLMDPLGVPTETEVKNVCELVARRRRREPLEYIRGSAEFWSREFFVDGRVLIPRPETELLVERVLYALPTLPRGSLVDVGTGSGVLAVTLAAETRDRPVFAVDISPDALDVAEKNARWHDVEDRITFLVGDLLEPLPAGLPVAAVISNPPYVSQPDMAVLQPEVGAWEPSDALAAGSDGLALYRRLTPMARDVLLPGGLLAVEVGWSQAQAVADMLQRCGFEDTVTHNDLSGIARVVTGCKPKEGTR